MVDIQKNFFSWSFYNSFSWSYSIKKANPILIEKNCLQRGPRRNSLNKEVSEDQANFKSGSSDQATSKLSITFLLKLFQPSEYLLLIL